MTLVTALIALGMVPSVADAQTRQGTLDTLERGVFGQLTEWAAGGWTLGAHEPRLIFPGESGQVDYAAHVTFRTCRLSNALGLRYPSDECSRYGL